MVSASVSFQVFSHTDVPKVPLDASSNSLCCQENKTLKASSLQFQKQFHPAFSLESLTKHSHLSFIHGLKNVTSFAQTKTNDEENTKQPLTQKATKSHLSHLLVRVPSAGTNILPLGGQRT